MNKIKFNIDLTVRGIRKFTPMERNDYLDDLQDSHNGAYLYFFLKNNTPQYIGVTSCIINRMAAHLTRMSEHQFDELWVVLLTKSFNIRNRSWPKKTRKLERQTIREYKPTLNRVG